MASPQILRPFTSRYHTCSTKDPSFKIGCCQVRFSVLIADHSATTYSALDVTHVSKKISSKKRVITKKASKKITSTKISSKKKASKKTASKKNVSKEIAGKEMTSKQIRRKNAIM